MTDLHEMAEAQRRADGVCQGCNGNEKYSIGDKTIWCPVCHPEKARSVLSDCSCHHLSSALAYWDGKRRIGFMVRLEGGARTEPKSHDYFISASGIEGAISTAKAVNWIVHTNVRCTLIRLMCPCDGYDNK